MKEIIIYYKIRVYDSIVEGQNDENMQKIYFLMDNENGHNPEIDFIYEIATYRALYERKNSFFRVDRIEQEVETNEQK